MSDYLRTQNSRLLSMSRQYCWMNERYAIKFFLSVLVECCYQIPIYLYQVTEIVKSTIDWFKWPHAKTRIEVLAKLFNSLSCLFWIIPNTKLFLRVCDESSNLDKTCGRATCLYGCFNKLHGWFHNPLIVWSFIFYKFGMNVLCDTIFLEGCRRFCESHIEVPFTCLVFTEE